MAKGDRIGGCVKRLAVAVFRLHLIADGNHTAGRLGHIKGGRGPLYILPHQRAGQVGDVIADIGRVEITHVRTLGHGIPCQGRHSVSPGQRDILGSLGCAFANKNRVLHLGGSTGIVVAPHRDFLHTGEGEGNRLGDCGPGGCSPFPDICCIVAVFDSVGDRLLPNGGAIEEFRGHRQGHDSIHRAHFAIERHQGGHRGLLGISPGMEAAKLIAGVEVKQFGRSACGEIHLVQGRGGTVCHSRLDEGVIPGIHAAAHGIGRATDNFGLGDDLIIAGGLVDFQELSIHGQAPVLTVVVTSQTHDCRAETGLDDGGADGRRVFRLGPVLGVEIL